MFDALPVAHHLLLAHGKAVNTLRAIGAESIGCATNHTPVWAATNSLEDKEAANAYATLWNRLFSDPMLRGAYPEAFGALMPGPVEDDLEVISAPLDFYGVNYYNPTRVAGPSSDLPADGGIPDAEGLPFKIVAVEGHDHTDFGWPVAPDGLRDLLAMMSHEYDGVLPPVYVTESGCAYNDEPGPDGRVEDDARIAYLDGHLRAVGQAIEAGVDVRGFYTWSLIDNFEWAEGYTKRFGLVHVDYATQKRTPKASYQWYADVIAANRSRYCPPSADPAARGRPTVPDRAHRPCGTQMGRLDHPGQHRPVGWVLRTDPGAARPAGRAGLPRPQGAHVRAGHRLRRRRLGHLQPSVRDWSCWRLRTPCW